MPDNLRELDSSPDGLTSSEAARRLALASNRLAASRQTSVARLVARRLANPLVLILLAASLISALTGDTTSFLFVFVIVVMSIALDLFQEHRAGRAVEALHYSVALRSRVSRDGAMEDVAIDDLVTGDVVGLAAGDLIPADGRLTEARDFFVNQSALSGEALPLEKRAEADATTPTDALSCSNAVFRGSSVISGSARMLICATGARTEFGRVATSLSVDPPPTAFEQGTRRLGSLLARASILLVLFVLFVNAWHGRPLLESFVFAVALAVGLTPELLPMIVSVVLARGAMRMARRDVVVKRLAAVEDLGSMDVLCTDKTGTLTEATLHVERSLESLGNDSTRVLELAWLNSHFESGLKSALDDSILAFGPLHGVDVKAPWTKLDEVPFDFERRRVSVLLQHGSGDRILIVKGAPEDVLRLSTEVRTTGGPVALDDARRAAIQQLFDRQSADGLRLIAVATRGLGAASDPTDAVGATDERDFAFEGFIAFSDPPKASCRAALASLAELGVRLKIVTGDNEAVTRHLCAALGIDVEGVLLGAQIAGMDDPTLRAAAERCNLFCRVTPVQKNRIVLAVKAAGHVVGYIGDGINDAPPLHSADVGISVDSAVDVARQAADLVLLKPDLGVLREGIREGRRAMINVNKYVLMATSSNFGNMVSMAAASVVLPFLPMLPVQILLNNFLYDLSELAIPVDTVAEQELAAPRHWDTAYVRRFMLWFGPLSSVFDLMGFGYLHWILQTPVAVFQSTWFIQSMATQVLVIFSIRTPRPFWRDRPALSLVLGSVAVVGIAAALPFTSLGHAFGLVPPPRDALLMLAVLTVAYLITVEFAKIVFHRQERRGAVRPPRPLPP